MPHNVIFRPVFNRPEMLQLSIDYEAEARKTGDIQDNEYTTWFLVEHGAPEKVHEIVENYPFPSVRLYRNRWWRSGEKKRYGISRNLLEGMKKGFPTADNHGIVIEDDILIHKSYFNYITAVLNAIGDINYSVISATGYRNDSSNCSIVSTKPRHFSPLAPLISKPFWNNYIRPYSKSSYYQNRKKTVARLNTAYKSNWDKEYKFNDSTTYNNHDGLINRLVDVAYIEEKRLMLTPEVSRQMHIGIYGLNNKSKPIPGNSYHERLDALRKIVLDNRLKEFNNSNVIPEKGFRKELDSWNGMIDLRQ